MNSYPYLLLFLYSIASATMCVCTQTPSESDVIQDAQQELIALHEACMQGDLKKAQRIIGESTLINMCNQQGETALHIAARFDQREIMQLLLDRGALVNAQDQDGLTPLCWTSYKSYPDLTRLLLNHGALVTLSSSRGNTPLHFAVYNHHHKVPERLRTYTTFKMLVLCDHPVNKEHVPQGAIRSWLSLQERCLRCLASRRIEDDRLKILPDDLKRRLERQKLACKRSVLALKNTNKVTARDIAVQREHDDVVTFIDHVLNAQALGELEEPSSQNP